MTIHWVTAFIDVPADSFDDALRFWSAATETTPSARRGDREQFLTLEPSDGASSLRMQVHEGPARVHIDLHVDDLAAYRDRAVSLGARVLAEPGHVIMRSPGGLVFCFVPGSGEERLGALVSDPVPHRVDQLCVGDSHVQWTIMHDPAGLEYCVTNRTLG